MTPLAPRHDLLKPREVAEMLGISPPSLARFARQGRIAAAFTTPGGHRRYARQEVTRFLAAQRDLGVDTRPFEDMVRLYEQGWTIRQVAQKFDLSYGMTRRILLRHTALRTRGGVPPSQMGPFD